MFTAASAQLRPKSWSGHHSRPVNTHWAVHRTQHFLQQPALLLTSICYCILKNALLIAHQICPSILIFFLLLLTWVNVDLVGTGSPRSSIRHIPMCQEAWRTGLVVCILIPGTHVFLSLPQISEYGCTISSFLLIFTHWPPTQASGSSLWFFTPSVAFSVILLKVKACVWDPTTRWGSNIPDCITKSHIISGLVDFSCVHLLNVRNSVLPPRHKEKHHGQ